MAIFYYPNPTTQQGTFNYNYVPGDYYVDKNGSATKVSLSTTPAALKGGLKYGANPAPAPYGAVNPAPIYPNLASSLTTATTVVATRGQPINIVVGNATGGSAVVPTGGTVAASLPTTIVYGVTPIYTYSTSPALPAGLSVTSVITTSSGTYGRNVIGKPNALGTTELFNYADIAITGTPTVTTAVTEYTITVTDGSTATTRTSTFKVSIQVDSGLPPLYATQKTPSVSLNQGFAASPFTPVLGSGGDGA